MMIKRKVEFSPITITIETEEELELFKTMFYDFWVHSNGKFCFYTRQPYHKLLNRLLEEL